MKLDRLILKGFLTFDYLDYEFEQRPLLIQGLNLTDDSQKTNGTGKSGLQTGIEFCITSSFSGYEQLVTYGKESGSAELYASCDVRKEEIHIHWDIRLKGSNKLNVRIQKYDENQWADVAFSNVNDGKKFIIDWFAISKEDISNYFIINNSRFKSFFKSSNKEKVDLINRFSDASIIEGLEKVDISEMELELKKSQDIVLATEAKIELLGEQIETEKNRDFKLELKEDGVGFELEISKIENEIVKDFEEIDIEQTNIFDFRDDIEIYKNNITTIGSSVGAINISIDSNSDLLKEINKSLEVALKDFNNLEVTDWDYKREYLESDLETDVNYLEVHKEEEIKLETQEGTILKFLQGIETKLAGAVQCPKCDYKFLLKCDIHKEKSKKEKGKILKGKIIESISENQEKISQVKEIIDSIESKISDINKLEQVENSKSNEFQQIINVIKERLNNAKTAGGLLQTELFGIDNKIQKEKLNIKSCEGMINECKSNITIHKSNTKARKNQIKVVKSNIERLSIGNNKEYINTLENSERALGLLAVEEKNDSDKIGDNIYIKNQWMNNFKQFRLFLANKSLEVIEFHCNRFLTDMGSDMKVKMEGYKILASGKIKEEITAKIIRGTDERTFNSFSGGERGRLLFASILANRQMINETHPYGGFDFLAVDEVFEGVDSLGLQSLINSIKSLGITVMIVTHVSDESESNDILTIVKENGISRIKK